MRQALTAGAVIMCLTGCMVGPDYRRPAVDVPPTWRFEDREAKTVANTAWWEQFGDPVLNGLILVALQENKDVKIAAARIENFLGQYRTTRAALFPQLSTGASAGQQRTSEVSGPRPQLQAIPNHTATFNDFQTSLSLGWEIDVWGKLRRATEAARANLLGTEEGRRSVILTLVTSVAISYVNLRDLDRQLEVTRRTARSYLEAFELMKLRFQHGVVSELEIYQTRSQYEQAAANIPFFEKAIAQQENALSVLLGRNPGPIPRGKSIDELVLPAVPAGVPSAILENRPDIRQAEENLIAANANIGVAKALYFPSISLTGLLGVASSDLSKLFTGPALAWSYAGNLAAPIFTGGAIAGQVKSAEAAQEENLVRYQQAIQTAFREVDDALVDQQQTREQLAALAQQVAALRDYVRIARLRYDGGYASYLDVVYAESQLYTAELTYVGAQGALFQALVNVYKAMGGGWVTEAERAASQSQSPAAPKDAR
jgi:multidrug efflux system outer membrane protein